MASTALTLPTVGSNAGSGTDWSNPTRITADDSSEATNSGTNSKDLLGSSYGFSIPSGATINGIEFVGRGYNPDGSVGTTTWYLYKGGSRVPTSFTGSFSTGSPNIITKGSSTELWGTTWTPSDINASNFGTGMAISGNGSGNQAGVDFHKVKVYYTDPVTNNPAFLLNFI